MPNEIDAIENVMREALDALGQTFGGSTVFDDLGRACLGLIGHIRNLEARVTQLEARTRQGE